MKKKIIVLGIFILTISVMIGGCKKADKKTEHKNLSTIVVGCDNYSPFSYADSNGEMTGIDVELAREAFSRIGYAPKFEFIN